MQHIDEPDITRECLTYYETSNIGLFWELTIKTQQLNIRIISALLSAKVVSEF